MIVWCQVVALYCLWPSASKNRLWFSSLSLHLGEIPLKVNFREILVPQNRNLSSQKHFFEFNKSFILGSSRRLQAKLGNLKKHTHGQMSPSLARRGSAVSTVVSITRRNSGVSLALSRKDEKMSVATVSKDDKGVEKGEEKVTVLKDTQEEKINQGKSSEIQVIPIASPETPQPHNEGKLLPQRSRSSRRLLPGKQPPKSAGKKRVPLDAISCISDYSVLSNIEFQPRVTPLGKDGQQGGTSLLTSKSLKDFTNSPEGKELCWKHCLSPVAVTKHLNEPTL